MFMVSSGPGDSNPQQQGEKSRDPQWDEFIRSVGQLGQLIMLLSWRQGEGGGGRGSKEEEMWGVCERGREGCGENKSK